MHTRILALLLLLGPEVADAAVASSQVIPVRPIVLEDGDVDVSGDALMTIADRANGMHVGETVSLPLGVDMGIGGMWEVGARVALDARPQVGSSWQLRTRLRPTQTQWLALGLWLEMPFGFMTERLGPRGLPLHFELPAVRLERAIGAVQATLRWDLGFVSGGVTKGVGVEVAGVMRITQEFFALMQVGNDANDFQLDLTRVAFALGAGKRVTEQLWVKVTAQTDDLAAFTEWAFFVTVVNRWEDPRKSVIPR